MGDDRHDEQPDGDVPKPNVPTSGAKPPAPGDDASHGHDDEVVGYDFRDHLQPAIDPRPSIESTPGPNPGMGPGPSTHPWPRRGPPEPQIAKGTWDGLTKRLRGSGVAGWPGLAAMVIGLCALLVAKPWILPDRAPGRPATEPHVERSLGVAPLSPLGGPSPLARVPSNAFLLRPHGIRSAARASHVPRHLGPSCESGMPCSGDYPLGTIARAARPTPGYPDVWAVLSRKAGLPTGSVDMTLDDGSVVRTSLRNEGVDVQGRIVAATPVTAGLLQDMGAAAMALGLGWFAWLLLDRFADEDGWIAAGGACARLLCGLGSLGAMLAMDGHAPDAKVLGYGMIATVLANPRTRFAVTTPLLAWVAGRSLAGIPLVPGYPTLAASYGSLGVYGWDMAGAAAILSLATLAALTGLVGFRHRTTAIG